MTRAKSPIPEGYSTVTPVLVHSDTKKAIDWYKKALGAQQQSFYTDPEGKVAHASIRIGNSYLMLHDEMMKTKSARSLGGSPVEIWLYVDDCDAVFDRAVKNGATAVVPVADQFWGDRFGAFTDPFGLSWAVATHKEDLSEKELLQRQKESVGELVGKTS